MGLGAEIFIVQGYPFCNIQSGSKVGIQYTVNYCIPNFGPPCILTVTNIETARNDEAISSKSNVRGTLNWCELCTQNNQLQ